MANRFLTRLYNYIARNEGSAPVELAQLYDGKAVFNDPISDADKLLKVINSPAMLKVVALQCDMFSLGKIKVFKRTAAGLKEIPDDPAIDRFADANPMQSSSQILWDMMFWLMLGNAYCYMDSNIATNEDLKMYFLEHQKMIVPDELRTAQDKFIFSKSTLEKLNNIQIEYRYDDGSSIFIPFGKITCLADLTNGIGNFFKGPSRIDALYEIIDNAKEIIEGENVNYRMTKKFAVSGQQDPKDTTKSPLQPKERENAEWKFNSKKPVHVMKSMIEIKRFVSDLRALALPEQYLAQYFRIGNMFNIPRDVLEAFNSSTYENQEKARMSHVAYTLQPKGGDFMQGIAKRWGYLAKKKYITIDWSHLPFMQVFEKERAATRKTQAETVAILAKGKVPIEEINEFVGTKFTNFEYEQPKPQNNGNQQQPQS